MHIVIEKKILNKLQKASEFTGINAEELAHRALVLYLESIRDQLELEAELRAWEHLGGSSLQNMERRIASPL